MTKSAFILALKNGAGFTLIELLVVVSVIALLTTIGLAGYNRFNDQQMVRRAKEEVKIAIRQAASRAQNNEKDCTVCGGSDRDCATFIEGDDFVLDSWNVEIQPTSARIYGACSGEFGEESIDLFGVGLSPSTTIEFYPLASGGGTNLGTPLTITFSKAGASNETIVVDPSGNVQ